MKVNKCSQCDNYVDENEVINRVVKVTKNMMVCTDCFNNAKERVDKNLGKLEEVIKEIYEDQGKPSEFKVPDLTGKFFYKD